jgi:hypothetical protein
MFTKYNTTLVVQGNTYLDHTEDFLNKYKNQFSNVIFSTWENEKITSEDFIIIKNKIPSNPGPANINLQLKSSLEGCKLSKTKYTIKVRSDLFIKNIDEWLTFFSEHYVSKRIFVLGLSNIHLFSPRDHVFAGETEDLIKLFDLKPMESSYNSAPLITSFYPELYLGLSYYSNFSNQAKDFLAYPDKYILSDAPLKEEAKEEWNKIALQYMYPVPRSLKYNWVKTYPDRDYPYDETAALYGEFWHEDIVNNKSIY